MEFERTRKRTPEINLTALIDIVFHLMVFVMLTTSFVITQSMELPPVLQTPRQFHRLFDGVMTREGVRSLWNGHLPSRFAPCRTSFTPRASANRCTDTSRFSRSTSSSGILAICAAFRKNPVKWFSRVFYCVHK